MRTIQVLVLVGFALSATLLSAQTITVRVPNCDEALYRFAFNGVNFTKLELLTGSNGSLTFPNQVDRTSIIYIGTESGGQLPILLDGKESFTITGNCQSLLQAVITGSKVNDEYAELKKEMATLKETGNRLTQKLRLNQVGTPAYEQIKAELKANDEARIARLTALQAQADNFYGAMWAADLYSSFENTQKPYGSELDYFVNERFQYADFSKPGFQNNPWVYEAFREVTKVLTDSGLGADAVEAYLKGYLSLAVNYPAAHKMALGGVIASLRASSSPLAANFARDYIRRFGDQEADAKAILEPEIQRLSAFADGGLAPSFSQNLLDGSGATGPQDFRGKILLIDFWASWCGPCRRENPSVVAMYKEFNKQGFEILGVSLDQSEDAWRKAVEQDQLSWKHVSDLKGWSNAASQQYGVRSIPATVLLDREGRIVARNLRGEALRAKVAELVGQE